MAKRQSRFMVGLFVIVGVLIGVVVIVWLGAAKYFQKGARYVTYFDESVQGLQVDSRVKYRGVDVGSVERIGVAPDQRLVEVVVKIDLAGDITRSIVTQLKAAGITGIVFVELDRQEPDEPIFIPPAGMKTVYPVIPSQPSQTKQMLSSVDRIMDKIALVDLSGIAEQLKQTSQAIEASLTGREMVNILKNLDSSTAALDRNLQRIDRILAEGKADSIVSALEQGIGEARQGIGETRAGIGETRAGIAEIRKLLGAIGKEVEDLKTAEIAGKSKNLIKEVDRRTKAVASDIESTTDEIRQAVESLRMLIEGLRENPSDLLFSRPVRDIHEKRER
ncbi:MAG: MCE family protein [Deltaproteobacteria bacterium]|nr:MAG: MCE family protein [Deltaproteobacteria bacterium]